MIRSSKHSQHIARAIASLAKAQMEMSKQIERHEKVLDSHAGEIYDLQTAVSDLRNRAIKAELMAGITGVAVAKNYGLTPGRISQIKNS